MAEGGATDIGVVVIGRDEAEVDKYVADPLCGFDLDPETIPALFGSAARLGDPEALAGIRSGCGVIAVWTEEPRAAKP